ncbi:MAG: ABC transporter substrate-binding protein [Proteobacteria bacterium]|nr:ABC transporter substrate-binding protein [Pseudomonadota bacterium]
MFANIIRLTAIAALAFTLTARAAQAGEPVLRIAVLKFGTVNWELDVIKHHGLDKANGFTLEVMPVANKQASTIMFQGREADMIVTDWVWVARQRAEGRDFRLIPYSRSVGGMVVAADSPIRSLADLKGKKIGIAGGPVDKSWILIQALVKKRHGIDLAREAEPVFGAPPLLFQKGLSGELDAVISFWHFLAKMEARGMRRIVDVADAAAELGLNPETPLLGYAFRGGWAKNNPALASGLARASRQAKDILRDSDAEWARLRPKMKAKDDATFAALRDGFRAGIPGGGKMDMESAKAMFAVLAALGGEKLVGKATTVEPELFFLN